MTIKFHINIPTELKQLADAFKKENAKLYLVGGAVRDAYLGKKPKDYDVVTEIQPDKVIQILNKHNIKNLDKDFRFGIIRAYINGEEFEIATTRKDIGKGRRPDSVEFTDISNDARRRDLTINALYYDIEKEEIIDLVGGLKDLDKNKVKTVGSAVDRFDEDPLRKMRAIRFAGTMNSKLDKSVEKAFLEDNSLKDISNERIRDEFVKTLKKAKSVKYVLELLNKFGFLKNNIFPKLNINLTNNSKFNNNYIPVIATLLKNNDTEIISKELNKLKYSDEEIKKINYLIHILNFNINDLLKLNKQKIVSKIENNEITDFTNFNNLDNNLIYALLKFKPNNDIVSKIANKLNVKPGKEYGELALKIEIKRFNKLLK